MCDDGSETIIKVIYRSVTGLSKTVITGIHKGMSFCSVIIT